MGDLSGGDSSKEEPKVANDEPYSLQEENLQGEESSDATAKETDKNMVEIASKAGFTSRVSDPLEGDTPWEISDDAKVAENDEYGTDSTSNFESKERASIPLEGDTPREISDDTKVAENDEYGTDSTS